MEPLLQRASHVRWARSGDSCRHGAYFSAGGQALHADAHAGADAMAADAVVAATNSASTPGAPVTGVPGVGHSPGHTPFRCGAVTVVQVAITVTVAVREWPVAVGAWRSARPGFMCAG